MVLGGEPDEEGKMAEVCKAKATVSKGERGDVERKVGGIANGDGVEKVGGY